MAQSDSDTAEAPLFMVRRSPFAGKTMEEKLQEVTDREEIHDLIHTYAHRVAHAQSNADLFTDDGAYINRRDPDAPPKVVRGRAELDAHFVVRPGGFGAAMPMIHNILLAIDGDEATGICSIELRVGDAGVSTIASGFYQDRLRRENGQWKFVERDVTFFHWVPMAEGWTKPGAEAAR